MCVCHLVDDYYLLKRFAVECLDAELECVEDLLVALSDSGKYDLFGRESAGLPPEFYSRYADDLRTIPMPGKFNRSLNLANSVSIVFYEAMRQNEALLDS